MPTEERELVPPGPVVEVWWVDTETSVGWRDHAELKMARTGPLMLCCSVGYLVEDNHDRVIIIQSFSETSHAERTIIPKAVVTKIVKVRPLARSQRARYGEHR
jgi:hypothetical protein